MKECVSKEKRIYDLKQLLEISKSLNSLLEFTHLVEAILYVAMAQTKTLGAALFTKKNAGMKKLSLSRNVCGFDVSHHAQLIISEEDPILRLLDEKACCLSPEEVQSALAPSKSVRSLLDLQPSLFVPLRAKDHLVGLILLGKKINVHEAYTPYDQSIIMDIAQLAAIAINNALLLEQATTDMMTQMKLKHYFFAMLTAKLDTLSTQETVSVLMLDIDFFQTDQRHARSSVWRSSSPTCGRNYSILHPSMRHRLSLWGRRIYAHAIQQLVSGSCARCRTHSRGNRAIDHPLP